MKGDWSSITRKDVEKQQQFHVGVLQKWTDLKFVFTEEHLTAILNNMEKYSTLAMKPKLTACSAPTTEFGNHPSISVPLRRTAI